MPPTNPDFDPLKVVARVLADLPSGVDITEGATRELDTVGQCRLYFEEIPVDLFLDTNGFHIDLHLHVAHHELGGRKLPFLSCDDLGVFKCFFNRRKDWADLEATIKAGRCDVAYVGGVLTEVLGADDERIANLLALRDEVRIARDSGA